MGLVESYSRVRSAIVAFAPRHPELIRPGAKPFEFIFGTGFIVDDSLIATNAHVAEMCSIWPRKQIVAIVFVKTKHGGMGTLFLNVIDGFFVQAVAKPGLYTGNNRPDLAVLAVDCRGLSELAVRLRVDAMPEGTAIATAGFPLGPQLIHLEGQLDHPSPTLQSGIVSATLPFDVPEPHGYLINVMVQGGASGSPVFLHDTGEVIGVVYARRYELEEQPKGSNDTPLELNRLPTNLTHVVPSAHLARLIEEHKAELLESVPATVPNIADIIAQLPAQPTENVVAGEFRWGSCS